MTELASDPMAYPAGDERTVLVSFLDYYRTVLIRKAEGLDDDQLRTRIEPGEMTLLGLVRHMAEVERNWFRRRFAGQLAPPRWYSDQDPDGDFHLAAGDTAAEALAALRDEIAFAQRVTAEADMDDLAPELQGQRVPGWRPNMRWVLIHMIEEYARHCGHADLLRERIDGQLGD